MSIEDLILIEAKRALTRDFRSCLEAEPKGYVVSSGLVQALWSPDELKLLQSQ